MDWKHILAIVIAAASFSFMVFRVTGCAEKLGTTDFACIEHPWLYGCPRVPEKLPPEVK